MIDPAQPLVSVIVPVYNVESYLRQCLNSLVGQSLRQLEIICVDDGSTDNSPAILAEYAARDMRVRVLTQANSGPSVARNAALEVARAPYIMFCDSDDWYESTMCERMYTIIETSGCDIAVCGIELSYESDRERHIADAEYYKIKFRGAQAMNDYVRRTIDVSPCNKIWKREIIDQYGIRFPEGLKYEDAFFYYAYMAPVHSAYFLPTKLYHYRRRRGSIMHDARSKKSTDSIHHLRVAGRLYDFYQRHHFFPKEYFLWVTLLCGFLDFSLIHAGTEEEEKEINELAATYVRTYIKDTSDFPHYLARKIQLIARGGRIVTRRFPLTIKEDIAHKKYYILGFPLFKIKYTDNHTKYTLLGIIRFRKRTALEGYPESFTRAPTK